MSTSSENLESLPKDIRSLLKKISRGEDFDADDLKTITEVFSTDSITRPTFILEQINKILKAVIDSKANDKKVYSEMLEKIAKFLNTKSIIDTLKSNTELANSIKTQLTKIVEVVPLPSIDAIITSLKTQAGAVISALPSQLQPHASAVLTQTEKAARQFAQDVTQNPQQAMVAAFNTARDIGKHTLRETASQAKDFAIAQAPAVVAKALEVINNFEDLKKVCQQVIDTSGPAIKQFVQLVENHEQLQVISNATKSMVAAIEMGKNPSEGLPIQCTFVTETLKNILPTTLDLKAPLKPEIESVVNILKKTGQQPFKLSDGSLPEILEICRTCAKLGAAVHVDTADAGIKAAVKDLGDKMGGVVFLPPEPAKSLRI